MPNQEQIDVIKAGQGFIAALDQAAALHQRPWPRME